MLGFYLLIDAEAFDFNAEEQLSDVNNITSLLKLWFRELPDPLFTREMYQDFINAASKLIICHLFLYVVYVQSIINYCYYYFKKTLMTRNVFLSFMIALIIFRMQITVH